MPALPWRIILLGAEVVIGLLLMVLILLQQRGAGLGSAFGGEGGAFASRRGIEKVFFSATIVLSVLFLLLAIVAFTLRV